MPRARRAPSISPSILLSALAMLLTAGCPKITPIPLECPANEPAAGGLCAAGAFCAYGDDTCLRTYQCVDGAWQSRTDEGDGCLIPPPEPGPCPTSLPTAGAPCKSPGQACEFTFPGDCLGLFVAACGEDRQWAVTDNSPPCEPPDCPPEEPMSGAPCSGALSCTYTALPPGCPPETHDAACVQGAWQIETPGTCVP